MYFNKLKREFQDPEYAHTYAFGFLNSYIATQIKVLRESREWTQAILAQEVNMKQSRISTLEDVNYSAWSISTLRRLAKAFNLRLKVSFEEFGSLFQEIDTFSRKSLERRPFESDPVFHEYNVMNRHIASGSALASVVYLRDYEQKKGALQERLEKDAITQKTHYPTALQGFDEPQNALRGA